MMEITLTTKQIMAMANFAGLKVDLHGLDADDETEYTIDTDFDVTFNGENKRVTIFYCTEYPDEGAVEI
ncbi:hypothetical protein ACISK3_09255 [Morganella morganii]